MSAREPAVDDANAAWVMAEVPLPTATVAAFVQDIGRLIRLNPFLEIESWSGPAGPIAAGNRYRLRGLNEMNGLRFDAVLAIDHVDPVGGFRASYETGLKRALEASVDGGREGARLTLREHYHTPPEGDEAALAQIDRSLVPWGAAVRRHLIGRKRWGWLPGYVPIVERFWLAMSPRQRRISRMIAWISVAEFVLFMLLAAVLWSESAG